MGIDIFNELEKEYKIVDLKLQLEETIEIAQLKGQKDGESRLKILTNKLLKDALTIDKKSNPFLHVSGVVSDERSALIALANNPFYSLYANVKDKTKSTISDHLITIVPLYINNYPTLQKFLNYIDLLISRSESHWFILDSVDKFKNDVSLETNNTYGFLNAEHQNHLELSISYKELQERNELLETDLKRLHEINSESINNLLKLKKLEQEKSDYNFQLKNLVNQLGHFIKIDKKKYFLRIELATLNHILDFLQEEFIIDSDIEYVHFETAISINGAISYKINLKETEWTAKDIGLFSYHLKHKFFNVNNYLNISFEKWFLEIFPITTDGKGDLTPKRFNRYIRPYTSTNDDKISQRINSFFDSIT